MLFVTILRITLVDQDSMQVSQLIDSIGPADWFVIVLAEPGEPLFEQRQCPLNERLERRSLFDMQFSSRISRIGKWKE